MSYFETNVTSEYCVLTGSTTLNEDRFVGRGGHLISLTGEGKVQTHCYMTAPLNYILTDIRGKNVDKSGIYRKKEREEVG